MQTSNDPNSPVLRPNTWIDRTGDTIEVSRVAERFYIELSCGAKFADVSLSASQAYEIAEALHELYRGYEKTVRANLYPDEGPAG